MVKHKEGYCVAVVGATGAVGREMITVLAERNFPVGELRLLASERSIGTALEYLGDEVPVERLGGDSFSGVDIALFSAGGEVSGEYGPLAANAGAVVIDNSSFFRMHDSVPLVVPEVNAKEIEREAVKNPGGFIIANPNCSTIQLVVVLKPLADAFGLERVVVSTYQSVSGAGQKGMDELWNQTLALMNQKELAPAAFPHEIAFNCIPHIDVFLDDGYTKEEAKIINETRKILSLPELRVTTTAVRIPVMCGHSEAVTIEFRNSCSPEEARTILENAPGVCVYDDPNEKRYPLPRQIAGTDDIYVGRIRTDKSVRHGLNLWIVADNLRKGAALNAVQIAEHVIEHRAARSLVH